MSRLITIQNGPQRSIMVRLTVPRFSGPAAFAVKLVLGLSDIAALFERGRVGDVVKDDLHESFDVELEPDTGVGGTTSAGPIELLNDGGMLRLTVPALWRGVLSRYAERTENAMRLLRSLLTRLAEDSVQDTTANVAMQKLLYMLAHPGDVDGLMRRRGRTLSPAQIEHRIQAYLFDPAEPNGIPQLVKTVNRVASLTRDRLSLDAWRTLDQLHQEALRQRPRVWLDIGDASAILNDMLRTMSAFAGLGMENTTRTQGWRFLDMGRRMERAATMAGLLRGLLSAGDPERQGFLDRLLELADSFMTYRARYVSAPRLVPVLDLLLVDESNPRSVGFQLDVLEQHAARLPRFGDALDRSPEQRQILSCQAAIRLADVRLLAQVDGKGRRVELDTLLARVAGALADLSETIGRHYFSHADLGRHTEAASLRRFFEP